MPFDGERHGARLAHRQLATRCRDEALKSAARTEDEQAPRSALVEAASEPCREARMAYMKFMTRAGR